MAFNIPTTSELVSQFIANFESKINQTIPSIARSFIRVLSKIQGLQVTGLYKYGIERALQNLVLTATGDDLDTLGEEYGVFRKAAESAILEINGSGVDSTIIPLGTVWISDDTNGEYTTNDTYTILSGSATMEITADIPGELGNLPVDSTFTVGSPISGLDNASIQTDVINEGLDRETDPDYRRRILNEIRTVGGGGNSADYRTWAEAVADVARAFPYAGKPIDLLVVRDDVAFSAADDALSSATTDWTAEGFQVGDQIEIEGAAQAANNRVARVVTIGPSTKLWVDFACTVEAPGATVTVSNLSLPGDRTVYIESRLGTGIPTAGLLEEARDAINIDPDTGIARPPLGETNDTLWIEPIAYTEFDVTVDNVQLAVELRASMEAKLEIALETYFEAAVPYIPGLDFEGDKNDVITDLSVSRVVQDVIGSVGGSADAVTIEIGATPYTTYTLGQGELSEFNSLTVNYA